MCALYQVCAVYVAEQLNHLHATALNSYNMQALEPIFELSFDATYLKSRRVGLHSGEGLALCFYMIRVNSLQLTASFQQIRFLEADSVSFLYRRGMLQNLPWSGKKPGESHKGIPNWWLLPMIFGALSGRAIRH
jgi:hypothetical protein